MEKDFSKHNIRKGVKEPVSRGVNAPGLSKDSTSEQIKAYFEKVLELYQSNDKFPINLDEVWPLVYSEKSKAVRALKNGFIEGEDYNLAQNGKVIQSIQIKNGVEVSYYLSVKCMEYFIAKKVRPVFEVYRQVFKKVATEAQSNPTSQLELLVQSAQALLEQSRRIDKVESRLDEIEKERDDNGVWLLQASISSEPLPQMTMRDNIRQLVNRYATATNTAQRDVWHKIYDQLYYLYKISIRSYKKDKRETNLDVAERNNFLEKIYIIISNLVRENAA